MENGRLPPVLRIIYCKPGIAWLAVFVSGLSFWLLVGCSIGRISYLPEYYYKCDIPQWFIQLADDKVVVNELEWKEYNKVAYLHGAPNSIAFVQGWVIWMKAGLSEKQRTDTLYHEVAHIFDHYNQVQDVHHYSKCWSTSKPKDYDETTIYKMMDFRRVRNTRSAKKQEISLHSMVSLAG